MLAYVEPEDDSRNTLLCSTSQCLYQKATPGHKNEKKELRNKEGLLTYAREVTFLSFFSFFPPSEHISTRPIYKSNDRCKLDQSCSEEKGLTIKQCKLPKLGLIRVPPDPKRKLLGSMWPAPRQTEVTGNHKSPPIYPSPLSQHRLAAPPRIDDPCSWSPSEF